MIPQGVIDEQMKRWGELLTPMKIRALASRVHHLASKKTVSNEIGMFVMLIREEVAKHIAAWEKSQSAAERERHALFMVEMFRDASNGATPLHIAGCMKAARTHGFPQLDDYLMQKLEAMDQSWDRSE